MLMEKSELLTGFAAVERLRVEGGLNSKTIADYLELLLITGLRRSERMKWQWTD